MTRNVRNGRCGACGHLFVGMDKWEYNWSVTRHVREEHPQSDPTELMEPL